MTLRIPGSASLKDKRQLVRSLTQRIRNQFHAAAAEVGDNDAWQVTTLGIACVSNSLSHCEQMLDEIGAYIERSRPDAEIIEVKKDAFPAFD